VGPTRPRSTFAVSGRVLRVFSFRRRAKVFTPLPLLSSSYLSPRSLNHLSAAPACARESTSPAVSSPTALDRNRRPYSPEIPTSGTVRPQGFSPSRRLTPPATLASLFHPACAPGVPPSPTARSHLSTRAGRVAPGFPLRCFLPPRDDRLVGSLLSCIRQVLRLRSASVISLPVKGAKPPDEYCRVSITERSVYPKVASQGHQHP
jgi:hypothetical protein